MYIVKSIKKIHEVIKTEVEANMLEAVSQEVQATMSTDIRGGDGSWQKRGFSSKNGLVTFIGAETGKVMDVEVCGLPRLPKL